MAGGNVRDVGFLFYVGFLWFFFIGGCFFFYRRGCGGRGFWGWFVRIERGIVDFGSGFVEVLI